MARGWKINPTTSWHDFRHHYIGIRFTYHLDAKKKE